MHVLQSPIPTGQCVKCHWTCAHMVGCGKGKKYECKKPQSVRRGMPSKLPKLCWKETICVCVSLSLSLSLCVCVCVCVCVCIYIWKKMGVSRGEGQKEKERILSRLHTQRRARCRAWSHNPGIMTWPKIKSRMLNRLSHPGTPAFLSFLSFFQQWKKNPEFVNISSTDSTLPLRTIVLKYLHCYQKKKGKKLLHQL